jgi:uncharacterized protein
VGVISALLEKVEPLAARAQPVDICIGAHWTLVSLIDEGRVRAGLASTLQGGAHTAHRSGSMPVADAGSLLTYSAADLAALAQSESLLEAGVGMATINALLDIDVGMTTEVNAAAVIAQQGAERAIAVVGHFPFVPKLREVAAQLWVLELNPSEGDLPAAAAADVLPQADVVALTGTSLLNGTFDDLISRCRPDAYVVVLGATTPLSPVLFAAGADAVSGTLVVDPETALLAVRQGATFRQIGGKRLLTMFKPAPQTAAP